MDTPFVLTIFGATGNLYLDKLSSALYLLYSQDTLPVDFTIIAFGRRELSSDDYREMTRMGIIKKKGAVDVDVLASFLQHVEYFKGDFSDSGDFIRLREVLEEKSQVFGEGKYLKIFHIATAPAMYETIFKNMKQSQVTSTQDSFSRIMIEKPFGEDVQSVEHLESVLREICTDERVFHIDHYMAKETARAILDFRQKNQSHEHMWNSEYIEKVKIVFHESNIVGSRGSSYDSVGAFRDVGENHMLELLAFVSMDMYEPRDGAHVVRIARSRVMDALTLNKSFPIKKAQYEDYIHEPGVQPDSKTETFFSVTLSLNTDRWRGTLFTLEGGKGLVDLGSDITTSTVSIEVYFKDGNKKEFKIQPVPGTLYDSYAKVYTDVIMNDQTLFVSYEELIAEWKLSDDLMDTWKDMPLIIYKKGVKPEDI